MAETCVSLGGRRCGRGSFFGGLGLLNSRRFGRYLYCEHTHILHVTHAHTMTSLDYCLRDICNNLVCSCIQEKLISIVLNEQD